MKKRLPLLISFVLFLALCASGAYWGTKLFKPKAREVVAPPPVAQAEIGIDGAVGLFGGKLVAAVASNYQLKGVISGHDPRRGIAILSADGQPSEAIPAGKKSSSGVEVTEVHPQYVMLNESGVAKRLDMPEGKGIVGGSFITPIAPRMPPPPQMNNDAPPPPPPQNSLRNATGLNMGAVMPGEPNVPALMGNNPGSEAENRPKPAMPSEPNGPVVDK